MNPVHFRKLMRIAVIIIAVAFLYSFFGWYLLFASSKENKRLAEIVKLADNQRVWGQRISNTSLLLLLNTALTDSAAADIHQKLTNTIALFEKEQASLLQLLKEPDAARKAGVMQLCNEINIHTNNFIGTAKEIAGASHALLVTNN